MISCRQIKKKDHIADGVYIKDLIAIAYNSLIRSLLSKYIFSDVDFVLKQVFFFLFPKLTITQNENWNKKELTKEYKKNTNIKGKIKNTRRGKAGANQKFIIY